jgi:hypothetical protein
LPPCKIYRAATPISYEKRGRIKSPESQKRTPATTIFGEGKPHFVTRLKVRNISGL